MGSVSLTHLNTAALFLLAYAGVFLSAWSSSFRQVLGVQPDLLPALMVYCGLKLSLARVTGLALAGGFWHDSLSANPLGTAVLPLFLAGWAIHRKRELILQDQAYAQFVLGCLAGAAVPMMSLLVVLGVGERPLLGWGLLWQWSVMAFSAGVAAPVVFWMLERVNAAFSYKRVPETSFRADREIKRGRA